MKRKTKDILLLSINIFIFISTLIITLYGVKNGAGNGQLGDKETGIKYFIPFTIDSNVFMGFISLIYILFQLTRKNNIPKYINVLYLAGSVSVTLTFLTVVVFLAPVFGSKYGWSMGLAFYSQDMFFYHFFNPVLAIIGLMLINEDNFNLKDRLISLIPMVIYSIEYIINVIFLKRWSDFYYFTLGNHYWITPISLIIMFGFTFLISFSLVKIKYKVNQK